MTIICDTNFIGENELRCNSNRLQSFGHINSSWRVDINLSTMKSLSPVLYCSVAIKSSASKEEFTLFTRKSASSVFLGDSWSSPTRAWEACAFGSDHVVDSTPRSALSSKAKDVLPCALLSAALKMALFFLEGLENKLLPLRFISSGNNSFHEHEG